MSGLKPGPISEAATKARATTNTGVSPLRCASVEMTGLVVGEADSFAALRNDSQKGKGKGNDQYRGLSTSLRFGRDDGVGGGRSRFLRCAAE